MFRDGLGSEFGVFGGAQILQRTTPTRVAIFLARSKGDKNFVLFQFFKVCKIAYVKLKGFCCC